MQVVKQTFVKQAHESIDDDDDGDYYDDDNIELLLWNG